MQSSHVNSFVGSMKSTTAVMSFPQRFLKGTVNPSLEYTDVSPEHCAKVRETRKSHGSHEVDGIKAIAMAWAKLHSIARGTSARQGYVKVLCHISVAKRSLH